MPTDKQTDQTIKKRAPYVKKASTRGGARPGGGRPKGSTTKVTLDDLMSNIELASGQTYGQLLAQNYVAAISRADWNGVRDYDKAFMNKLVADKQEVTTIDSGDAVAQKQAAFAAALAAITQISADAK
jgi:hypothetical protein